MAEKNKLSKEVEEQIQSLAGDIYIQVEDRISGLITSFENSLKISDDDVLKHPLFINLQEKSEQLVQSKIEVESLAKDKLTATEKKLAELTQTLAERDAQIKNNEELTTVKLTDTEQVLKEKLTLISALEEQLTSSQEKEATANTTLTSTQQSLARLQQEHDQRKSSEENLLKADKAKTATLEIQNQQISDLNTQLNEVNSQLEHIQSQQSQKETQTSQKLVQTEQEVEQLKKQLVDLDEKLAQTESAYIQGVEQDKANQLLIGELDYQINEYKGQLAQIESQAKGASEAQAKVAELNKALADEKTKSAQVNELTVQLANITAREKELDSQVTQLTEQLSGAQAASNKAAADTNNELTTVKAKNEQLIAELEAAYANAEQQEGQADTLGAQLAQASEQESQLKTELVQQSEKATSLAVELETVKKNLVNAEQGTKALEQQMATLTQELSGVSANTSEQTSQLKTTQDKLEQTLKTVTEHETSIKQKEDEIKALKSSTAETIKVVEAELADSKENHAKSQSELETAKKELETKYQSESAALNAQVAELTADKNAKEAQLKTLEQQAAQSKEVADKLADALKKSTELETQLAELKTTHEKAQADVELMNKQQLDAQEKVNQATEAESVAVKRLTNYREKHQGDHDKARDTIKYLRDENHELSAKHAQEVSDLEDKIREFRLRFEYAQKQLASQT